MSEKAIKVSVVIAAAGSGSRMSSNMPKQYISLCGVPIIIRTLSVFEESPVIDEIIIAARSEDTEYIASLVRDFGITKAAAIIPGGASRQESVHLALKAARGEIVLIHDAVRPFVANEQISAVVQCVQSYGAAALGVPVVDTLKRISGDTISETVDRSSLVSIQTPQGFKTSLILSAHEHAESSGLFVTDDCALCEEMGIPVKYVHGSRMNIKITTPEDLILAEGILNTTKKKEGDTMRIGTGFDVHRLAEDRRLILGGVEIPYTLGLLGHSDADVLLHAIMDAMLGAAALGDIGTHFPDTDEKWRNADSLVLLSEVRRILEKSGAYVTNIDATIIAQAPKLSPYISEMRKNISRTLGIDESAVSIKATTTEGLGFCGRGEGIAAEAICCITMR